MKNKKIGLFLFFLFAASMTLQAENPSESINKSSTTGIDDYGFYSKMLYGAKLQFGVVTENFYKQLSQENLYRISWLTWDTLPVFSLNFEIASGYKFNAFQSLNFEAFFSTSIPGKTGFMQDYDTLFFDNKITDYSFHENYTDSYISTGFYADFALLYGFGLGLGFEYEKVSFRGQNGYAQHNSDTGSPMGYWTADMPHTSEFDGITVITYDIFSFYWKSGIVWRFDITNQIYTGFDAWLYFYRYDNAMDKHYYTSKPNIPRLYYKDIIEEWINGYEIRAFAEYVVTPHFSIFTRLSGTYLPEAFGNDYISQKPSDFKLNDNYKGGFEAWSASGCLSFVFRL